MNSTLHVRKSFIPQSYFGIWMIWESSEIAQDHIKSLASDQDSSGLWRMTLQLSTEALFPSRLHKHSKEICLHSCGLLLEQVLSTSVRFQSKHKHAADGVQRGQRAAELSSEFKFKKKKSWELTCQGSAWRARCPSWFLGLCESKASWALVAGAAAPSLCPVSHCRQEKKT